MEVLGFNVVDLIVIVVVLLSGIFALARGLAAFGQQFLGEFIGQNVAYDIRNNIYNNLQRLSYAYHDKVQTGQIMSRVTQEVEGIRMFFSMGLLRTVNILLVLGNDALPFDERLRGS